MKRLTDRLSHISVLGRVALAVLFVLIVMALLAPVLTTFPHNRSSGPALAPPSTTHFLGTNDLGVDLWSMICYGARVSLTIGLGTALLAGLGGSLIGMIVGYKGGLSDTIVMRIIDMTVALPNLPLMIVLAAFFGPSLFNIILVLVMFSWQHLPERFGRLPCH